MSKFQTLGLRTEAKPESQFEYFADRAVLDELKDNDIITFNSVAESEFCDFICSLLERIPKLSSAKAVQEAAYELNVSPVTAKRYLVKHTADNARFCFVGKFLECKAHNHHERARLIKNRL